MSAGTTNLLLRISAILWVVWGLVHALAGVLTISGDTVAAISGIADAVDRASLTMNYPDAAGALINQHGFNLLWIGIVTAVGAIFIWRGSKTAVLVTALVGGLTDIGYFVFMDLGGFVKFAPGTVMTIVSATAIILSFLAAFRGTQPSADAI
ncbi:MAG: hypothetical protein AB8G17_13590 [Gammaproteobacteria bacterium]